jgi:nicotinate-nucleotide adenylyltransferase
MQKSFKKIGILGGTFNPIHCGHLIIAETVRESHGLEKVLLIPSGQPPHKPDREVLDPERRYEMVRRAAATNPLFEASRIEIDTEGVTYSVNTLQTLKRLYGNETTFYFIIGADVIPELTTWRDFQTVFGLCEFIAVRRPGYGGIPAEVCEAAVKREGLEDAKELEGPKGSEHAERLEVPEHARKPEVSGALTAGVTGATAETAEETVERLKKDYGVKIHLLDAPLVDISSSNIRERCRQGRSIKYLVPDAVEEYIETEGLYRKTL